jgi:tripartite-type tricarboxylate transporter receptor subunit TctC
MAAMAACAASAQDYPSKTIRIVAPSAGGGADLVGRLIAQGIAGPLGQNVIVDNRSAGIIPGQIVSKAPPDGHTLLLSGSLWISHLLQNAPYDPAADFSPITLAATAPTLLVVHPSLPVKSVKELVALAKARPRQLNSAAGSIGGSSHLAAELFNSMAGVDIVHVPYKGASQALNDLLAGEVQVMFPNAGSVMHHVSSGRLRALAVGDARPSALTPNLPTIAASGVAGFESAAKVGVFAPAATSDAIIKRLNHEMVRVLTSSAVKEKLFNSGLESVGSSPEQFGSIVRIEIAKWGEVIKNAGIRAR